MRRRLRSAVVARVKWVIAQQNDLPAMVFEELNLDGREKRTERWNLEGVVPMANDREQRREMKSDQAWPGAVEYKLGFGSENTGDVLWRCNVLRAGQLYSRTLFATRAEALEFAEKLSQVEPDKIFDVEAIKASTVWN